MPAYPPYVSFFRKDRSTVSKHIANDTFKGVTAYGCG